MTSSASLPTFTRQSILGVPFDVTSYAQVLDWIAHWPQERSAWLSAANVADIMLARKDASAMEALNAADRVVPDGQPVVWAMRDEGHDITERVYGPTMMEKALRDPRIAPKRHLLMAGRPNARDGVRKTFPEVNWIGEIDFFFNDLDEAGYAKMVEEYEALAPDYVWVSLGGGKQILFMHRFAPMVSRGIFFGVGAAFDFHAGLIPQAPMWMQKRGLESVFRFCAEPRRLWRRYFIQNPPFFYHWWRYQRSKKKAFG